MSNSDPFWIFVQLFLFVCFGKAGGCRRERDQIRQTKLQFFSFFPRKWQSPRKSNFVQKKVSNYYFVVDIGKAGLIGFWIESIKIVGFSTRILKAFRFPRKFWKYFRKSVSLPKFLPKILTIKNLKKIDKLTYQAVTASTCLFGPHLFPLQGNAEIKDYAENFTIVLIESESNSLKRP